MSQARRHTVALALFLGSATPLAAQARSVIVQSLDLSVPRQPGLVRIEGTTHLVHELHLSNLQRARVTIKRIQVQVGASGVVVADVRDTSLARVLGPPGTRGPADMAAVLEPGSRAVAYFWIPLKAQLTAPALVRHEVEVDVVRREGTVHASFAGGVAVVSRDEAVLLAPPLRGGPWAALYFPELMGGHRTVFYSVNGTARLPGRFAIDFARPSGLASKTGPGADVLAVADGVVVDVKDDMADNVGEPSRAAHALENASGNFVVLKIGEGRFAHYEHLQHGSIAVRQGDRVRTGHVLGRLGNSGSSSIGPHLHFHVADGPSTLGSEGVPFVFGTFEVLDGRASVDATTGRVRWDSRESGESVLRIRERPAPNVVLRFP